MRKKIIIGLIIFISLCMVSGIIFLYYKNENQIAILGYHGILPEKLNNNESGLVIDTELFEKQLKYLKKMGYKTMTLDEFNCWKNKECKKNHKSVLITFDDGYYDNYEYAFELLKKYDMNAVVFCVGTYIESNTDTFMSMEDIKNAQKEYPNIEFASHSYDMHFHSDKTYDEVIIDIEKMNNLIESKYYAYPFGDYNKEYARALKDQGFKNAFTFGPGREHRKVDINDDNFAIPRLNISNDMPMYKFILRLILPM